MNHRPLVFLDIETTGASARTSRITEVGALRVEAGRVVGTYRQLINPEEPVPHFITRLTGIDDAMLASAPSFREIAADLRDFLDGSLFIAHHVQFDYGFIQEEYRRMGGTFAMDRACTVRLSRRLYPAERSHSLDNVIRRLEVEVAERHRAFDDAEVLWKFFSRELEARGLDAFRELEHVTTYTRLPR